jgi:hypothetical protein
VNAVLLRLPPFGVTCAPLNLGHLAAVLRASGHTVRVIDLDAETFHEVDDEVRAAFWSRDTDTVVRALRDPRQLHRLLPATRLRAWVNRVLGLAPDLVGLSLYGNNVISSARLATHLRQASDAMIVAGGPYCRREGGVAQRLIARGYVDAVAVGEGEETLADLASHYRRGVGPAIAGALVRTAAGIVDGGPRPPVGDLDGLPFPDFTDLRLDAYAALAIATSRGCVNRCGFCADCTFWGKFRYRRAERVVAEIEHQVQRHGRTRFEFLDLLVNGNLRELERLCRLLVARQEARGPIAWRGFAFPRPMSRELVGLMRQAGCERLHLGVESGSPNVLRRFNRRVDPAAIEDLVRTCDQAGIAVGIDWMVGFPGETEEDFAATVDLARRLMPHTNGVRSRPASICRALVGSDLWASPARHGAVLREPTDGTSWDDGQVGPAIRQRRRHEFNAMLGEYCEVGGLSWAPEAAAPKGAGAPDKNRGE